jgi:ATP-dependent DNA helicase RecG
LFVKDKGKITNSDYQTLNDVSKATATRDLTELTETHKILKRTGDIGVGTNYILIGS